MKKLFKSLVAVGLIALSIQQSFALYTFTFTINAGTSTNLFPTFNNPIVVKQITIVSGATSACNLQMYDTSTNYSSFWQAGMPLWSYTNAPYTNITSYVTNYYTFTTNFYGVTSYSYTNKALIDVTNSVAVQTNYFSSPLYLSAGTNNTVTYTGIQANFNSGVWATNSGTGPAIVTTTYQ